MPLTSAVNQAGLAMDRFLSSHNERNSTIALPDALRGKRILITGAGGWIGSALARATLQGSPELLLLLDSCEGNLYEIDNAIQQENHRIAHASILGSVTDKAVLQELFQRYRPEFVFHAAAFKHVPLMEDNPFAAIENNALGTRMLADVARQHGAEQFLLISTDKAADPCGIMGASKRIAELATLGCAVSGMQTKVLRLVNVMGAQGSVIPRFLQQIAHGGPVTVTHREAQRYFVSLREAIELILATASSSLGSGLYIPGVEEQIKILEIAEHLIAVNASRAQIVFTGLRPGDKLKETLLSVRESLDTLQPPALTDSGVRILRVNRSGIPETMLTATLDHMAQAVEQRDLEALLCAVRKLVPEYSSTSIVRRQQVRGTAAGAPA